MEKLCKCCQKLFQPKRKHAQFCSTNCKSHYNNLKNRHPEAFKHLETVSVLENTENKETFYHDETVSMPEDTSNNEEFYYDETVSMDKNSIETGVIKSDVNDNTVYNINESFHRPQQPTKQDEITYDYQNSRYIQELIEHDKVKTLDENKNPEQNTPLNKEIALEKPFQTTANLTENKGLSKIESDIPKPKPPKPSTHLKRYSELKTQKANNKFLFRTTLIAGSVLLYWKMNKR